VFDFWLFLLVFILNVAMRRRNVRGKNPERRDKLSERSLQKNLTWRRDVGTFVAKILNVATRRRNVRWKNFERYNEASKRSFLISLTWLWGDAFRGSGDTAQKRDRHHFSF
jgi:hypothetical protein